MKDLRHTQHLAHALGTIMDLESKYEVIAVYSNYEMVSVQLRTDTAEEWQKILSELNAREPELTVYGETTHGKAKHLNVTLTACWHPPSVTEQVVLS